MRNRGLAATLAFFVSEKASHVAILRLANEWAENITKLYYSDLFTYPRLHQSSGILYIKYFAHACWVPKQVFCFVFIEHRFIKLIYSAFILSLRVYEKLALTLVWAFKIRLKRPWVISHVHKAIPAIYLALQYTFSTIYIP